MQIHLPDAGADAPFAVALRAAITNRGLALNRIQAKLAERGVQVGIATLSTWQSGRRQPRPSSASVVSALEDVLELPAGWLTVRIPPAHTEPPARVRPYAVVDYAAALTRLLDDVRPEAHGKLRSVTVVEEIVIGADHSLVSKQVVQSVVAVEEADRQIVVHQGEPGSDATLIAPRGMAGCRTGRVARDAESSAVLGELLLDRTLAVGDTAVIRYAIDDRTGEPTTQYYRFHEWPGTHHVLEVQFHRDALPVRVDQFRRPHSSAPDAEHRELMMTPDGRVHVVAPSTTPGVIGITWEWD
ncbi:hypothetical protein [Kribbella deserti]|uniref:XRE family transcriptional regulator n=1 Tax=Kribbella deserti TaxID=1926257 RepID=A0ABV6QT79_9ACTN